MSIRNRIVEILSESGVGFLEKSRTIYTTCPICNQSDKFSLLKDNGFGICYRGSCSYGKKPFVEWVSLTFKISNKEAREKIFGSKKEMSQDFRSSVFIDLQVAKQDDETFFDKIISSLKDIEYPEYFMSPIADKDSVSGMEYLLSRGITPEIAQKYDIMYSNFYKRVYLPVKMYGTVYGYQGRHVQNVPKNMRMRNNVGFQRDTLVMFADNLVGKDYCIMAEGPFDALKFENCGGNIATMGKVVTNKQIEIIKSFGIEKLYLALDEDAGNEMNNLIKETNFEQYFKINIPETCKNRCNLLNKKADFGECTFEEAEFAFKNAILIDKTFLSSYIV